MLTEQQLDEMGDLLMDNSTPAQGSDLLAILLETLSDEQMAILHAAMFGE